jgi:hypothetical protein
LESQAHLEECLAQLERMPEDVTLRDRIIGAGCTPVLEQVRLALGKVGGE